MTPARHTTRGTAAYRELQSPPMRMSLLYGTLSAFEAQDARPLPEHLDAARAPIDAVNAERLRLALASVVITAAVWALIVMIAGIAITREPGAVMGFAAVSTPVFALAMGFMSWKFNSGVVVPVSVDAMSAWRAALAATGYEESTWVSGTDRDVGTFRPCRGMGRIYLYDTVDGIAFLAGPMGRISPVAQHVLARQSEFHL